MYSIEGYKRNSPDRNNPFNIINSNRITMRDVEFPVMGVSNTGHKILMQPGQDYVFDGDYVIEYPYMQNGGTAGMDGMMKARLAIDSHFGNPTAKRMTNYDTRYYEFPDGNKGNVYVSSYDNLVTPQIQDVNGKLMFIDNPWSKENADRSYNQSMKFEREEDARYFGENYKKYAPMTNLYKKQEGGEMNEEIIMKIREALQQGMTPEQIVKELQKQGITEQEAIQLVSAAIPQQEEMQQYQYGTTVRHNYADNINFDNKFNATALGLNAVSDPRNMIWALPDTGFGSGLKAISGLASGLAGSYLGYAKLFSKDKIHVQDPKEKPIVSSPYIPEGKDVTKVVKPVSDLPPNWDWQTWNKQIENPYKTQIFKEANYQKGGMKKYQQGDRVMDMTSMNQMNPEFLNPEAFNITFNSMYPYLNNTQSFTTTQQEQNKPYNYNEDYGRYKQYLDNFAKQDFSQISEEKQNKKEKQNKPEGDSTITSMNDDALGFIIANNALIGFQNFNDVLSARDYEKEYNQMLMRTGNSDQRYNAINPTNPYGMYTPNAGIGSNYGLVANSHIQDFGTSMASAKYGGMKKKYQEGGIKSFDDLQKESKIKYEQKKKDELYTKNKIISNLPKEQSKNTCKFNECAEYVTNITDFTVRKNAWQMKNDIELNQGHIKYNMYDSIPMSNIKNADDLIKESDNYYKNLSKNDNEIIKNNLKQGDVVGLYYKPSKYHSKALKEGEGSANTHVGIVSGYDNNGEPIITHNIHGKLYHEPYSNLKTSKVAWIGEPSYKRIIPDYHNYIKNPNNNKYLDFVNKFLTQQEKIIHKGVDYTSNFINNQFKTIDKGVAYGKKLINRIFKEGGEYNLTQEEIDYILKNGGEIEILD